jgi:hypothetical protein
MNPLLSNFPAKPVRSSAASGEREKYETFATSKRLSLPNLKVNLHKALVGRGLKSMGGGRSALRPYNVQYR